MPRPQRSKEIKVLKQLMRAWRLEIEYEGTRYAGWQVQPYAKTVQGEIIRAAEEAFNGRVEIGGSGRTDAGVHALRQVAHLKIKSDAELPSNREIRNEINRLLPHDINLTNMRDVPPGFHARYDAVSRYYLYQVSTRRRAFGKTSVWWVRDRLNIDAMTEAAKLILGRHDFSSFTEKESDSDSTLVEVHTAEIAHFNDLILFRVGASHFLWKMVRRLTGALVEVGRGRITVEQFRELRDHYSAEAAAWTAPPSGLFLEHVLYHGDPRPGPVEPAFFSM